MRLPLIGLVLAGFAGCFSGELVSTSPDAAGRVAFDGARAPDGGAGGGAAGMGGGKGDDPVPPPTMCPYSGPPVVNPASLPGCVRGAHCQSDTAVPAPMQSHLQRCADGSSFCVPDEYIVSGGQFIPPSCRIDGGEGRCLSLAFRESRDAPQASCEADHACVPCFRSGQPTGLCTLACDQPATGTGGAGGAGAGGAGGGGAGGAGAGGAGGAGELARCCMGRGSCVPSAGVLGGRPDLLGRDICTQDLLCEPDAFRTAAGPQRCIVGQGALTGQIPDASGACVPSCVPLVGGVANVLTGLGIDPQGSCAVAEVCVPCTNPLDGQPTGACRS